jgi:DNA-binding NarL/FixJ family response regulator
MKNQKKLSVINKFPKILYMLTLSLKDENVDFILDASEFAQPVSLLRVTPPDYLMLNLNLPSAQAIELTNRSLQEDMEIRKGMITKSTSAYYISLCSTFSSSYIFDNSLDLALMPAAISMQQAN